MIAGLLSGAIDMIANLRPPRETPTSAALRAAGYAPAPRLWLRPEDIAALVRTAERYAADVNEIRAKVKEGRE